MTGRRGRRRARCPARWTGRAAGRRRGARRILGPMPALRAPGVRATARESSRAVVLGGLALDVVLVPARPLVRGTDVRAWFRIHQGGIRGQCARWLARLGGCAPTLVCASVRDGRASPSSPRCEPTAVGRPGGPGRGRPHGPDGMVVDAAGERSFVADRGAADLPTPPTSASGGSPARRAPPAPLLLLGGPLGLAARGPPRWRVARARLSVDLPPRAALAGGRAAAQACSAGVGPDLLFTNARRRRPSPGGAARCPAGVRPLVVIKARGGAGATVPWRGQAAGPTSASTLPRGPLGPPTPTGAGDPSTRDSWRPGWPPTGREPGRGASGRRGGPRCRRPPAGVAPARARAGVGPRGGPAGVGPDTRRHPAGGRRGRRAAGPHPHQVVAGRLPGHRPVGGARWPGSRHRGGSMADRTLVTPAGLDPGGLRRGACAACRVRRRRSRPRERRGGLGEVHAIYVDPDCQGRGIGRA